MRYIILIFMCVTVFTSCSEKNYTPTDLIYRFIEDENELPPYNIYFSEAEEGTESFFSQEKAMDLYDDMSPLELCSSHAVLLSKDDNVYEIHVYKATSQVNAQQIEKILSRRIDLIQNKDIYVYNEDNYEQIISKARTVKKGRYVFLLVTDKNNDIEDLLQKML